MNEPVEPAPGPDGSGRRPLVRGTDGRLLAGGCAGVADYLDVNVAVVRLLFALLVSNGVGVVAYVAFWLLAPDDQDDGTGHTRLHRPADVVRALRGSGASDDPHRRRKLIGYLAAGLAVGAVLGGVGIGVGSRSTLPVAVALVGALLIWWRMPEAQRAQWTREARHYGSRLGRRGPLLVVVGGVGLVVVGVTSFLAANNALSQARSGALGIGAVLLGALLVAGPWLLRVGRELSDERRARIREQERLEVAAHVHDSVLQTLALLQSRATDPDAVRRLARRQERELREWLYAPSANPESGLAGALRSAAAGVEDGHGVPIEVVVVGDAALDDRVAATVAAAREAMVNAARSSGARAVSVFAEVDEGSVQVWVRDRGRGFDLAAVPDDRRGIRESIVGRMARHGGKAHVRSGPTGTEVALTLARK